MQSGGATATMSILNAIGAILTGQASTVVCMYGVAISGGTLRVDGSKGGYGTFAYGYPRLYGFIGAGMTHALHARRHMHRYGTTSSTSARSRSRSGPTRPCGPARSATAGRSRSKITRARAWWLIRSGCSIVAATPTAACASSSRRSSGHATCVRPPRWCWASAPGTTCATGGRAMCTTCTTTSNRRSRRRSDRPASRSMTSMSPRSTTRSRSR